MPRSSTIQPFAGDVGDLGGDTPSVRLVLPEGRVLRSIESLQLRREVDKAASRTELTSRQRRVFDAAMNLTIGYCRLTDQVPLVQIAAEAGVDYVKNVGRDLAVLRKRGLIDYTPAIGRGRLGRVAVPLTLLGKVAIRLGLNVAADQPPAPPPDLEPCLEKVPGDAPFSTEDTVCSSLPREKTPSRSSIPSARPPANSASNTGAEPLRDEAVNRPIREAVVDEVVDGLPAALRAAASVDRARQAAAVRKLLAAGYTTSQIRTGLTSCLPPNVLTAAGFVAGRARRMLQQEPPAAAAARDRAAAQERRREWAAAERQAEADRREHAGMARQLSDATGRAMVRRVADGLTAPSSAMLSSLVGAELARLAPDAELTGSSLEAAVACWLGEGSAAVAAEAPIFTAPTVEGDARRIESWVAAELGRPIPAAVPITRPRGLLAEVTASSDCGCCGRPGPAEVRVELPIPMPVCADCWATEAAAG